MPLPVPFCVCTFTHVQSGCAQHFPGCSDSGLGALLRSSSSEETAVPGRGNKCCVAGSWVCLCGLWQSVRVLGALGITIAQWPQTVCPTPPPAPRPWLPPGSRVGRGMAAKSFEMMVTLAEEAASE